MKVYYSESYCASEHAFDTTRKSAFIAQSLRDDPIAGVELVAPTPLTFEELTQVHAPDYVRAVETGTPRHLAESNNFPWDPNLWEMVRASNGGVVAAALDCLENRAAGSLSSRLHHAHYECGTAFCTFNGLVLAARAALDKGVSRVLIVDFDAHYGDGTAALIAGNPAIQMVYPSFQYKIGMSGDPGEAYLDLCAAALDDADGRFELVIYNAGMDPYEGCGLGGRPGVTLEVLDTRERMVIDFCRSNGLPMAFVLAGGYVGPRLSQQRLIDLHRLTIKAAAEYAGTA